MANDLPAFETNPYFIKDKDMFVSLVEIVTKFKDNYATVLKHSKSDIGRWVDAILADILLEYQKENANYDIPTRNKIWFILHGATRPLKCKICGKTVFKKVLSVYQDNPPYCGMKCAGKDNAPKYKQAETKRRLYGNEEFNNRKKFLNTIREMPNERRKEWLNNVKKSFQSKYGVDSYMQTEQFKSDTLRYLHKTYGEQYDNILQVPEVRQKNMQTLLEKYGHPHWSNWEKGRNTCLEHYGAPVIFQTAEFKTYCSGIKKQISQKRSDTLIRNFGTPFPLTSKYEFNGNFYDSIPELAFALYLTDKNIDFHRNSTEYFTFVFKNKEHKYFPDFIINGEFVEIKGDQFFKDDGTMYCPYRLFMLG